MNHRSLHESHLRYSGRLDKSIDLRVVEKDNSRVHLVAVDPTALPPAGNCLRANANTLGDRLGLAEFPHWVVVWRS